MFEKLLKDRKRMLLCAVHLFSHPSILYSLKHIRVLLPSSEADTGREEGGRERVSKAHKQLAFEQEDGGGIAVGESPDIPVEEAARGQEGTEAGLEGVESEVILTNKMEVEVHVIPEKVGTEVQKPAEVEEEGEGKVDKERKKFKRHARSKNADSSPSLPEGTGVGQKRSAQQTESEKEGKKCKGGLPQDESAVFNALSSGLSDQPRRAQ
jgi:hypothetical protein